MFEKINMKDYASNLNKKGETEKIEKMESLQHRLENGTSNNLSGAFITKGYHGYYDVIAILPQSKDYEYKKGFIFYDDAKNEAVFHSDFEIYSSNLLGN